MRCFSIPSEDLYTYLPALFPHTYAFKSTALREVYIHLQVTAVKQEGRQSGEMLSVHSLQ